MASWTTLHRRYTHQPISTYLYEHKFPLPLSFLSHSHYPELRGALYPLTCYKPSNGFIQYPSRGTRFIHVEFVRTSFVPRVATRDPGEPYTYITTDL